MKNYENRVIQEQKELNDKIEKLVVFIKSDKFKDLDDINQKLLQKQKRYMQEYSDILLQRINLFR